MSNRLLLILSFLALLWCPNINFGQAPDLRSTRNFALFTAAGQFENVGAGSTVTGDAGTNVGAFLAYPPGTLIGVKYGPGSTEAAQAATDVALVYGDLAALTCDGIIGATLGNGQILTAGTYCTVDAATLDGDLLLDAEGDPSAIFVIRINGAFATSTFANVLLVNGANLCNVYWQIGGQFTLGGGATFLGTVVADGAIILNIGSTLNGRALSTAGAISTFDNTVTMSLCLPPTLACSVAASVSCENLVPAPDIASVTVTATCLGAYTVIHVGDVITNQTCPNRYTITRTYQVTDACGETATCEQTITVNDQILPSFTACPVLPFALGCNPPPITAAQAITAAGAATDNCGTPTMSASGSVITGDCLKSQTWTVTATDACDNTATCQVTFTWNSDTQNPSFANCPIGPVILGCTTTPPTAADAIAAAGPATDNCGNPIVSATGGVITGDCLKSQTWTVTATDGCNNSGICLVTFNWSDSDSAPPTFTNCPTGPINLGCNPPPVTAAQAIAAAGPATDDCGNPIVTATAGVITGDCLKSQTWTVTATDVCNNAADCLVTFTWTSDTQNPSFTNCPTGPINLGCNPPPVTPAQAIAAAGSAADNCGMPTVTAIGGVITGDCVKSQTWTVTATDFCNNAAICLVTFTWISDTQNPSFTNCPTGPINLGCTPTPPTAANAIAAAGPATDNCGMPTITATGGIITGDCLKMQTWTVTATDACNNPAICLVVFTWSDSDAASPIFLNCPTGPINLGCNPPPVTAAQAIIAAGTAMDDCGTPTVTATGGVITGDCLKSQTWTVTATDVCNNAVNCLVTFTWTSDTQNPQILDIPDFVVPGCLNPAWPVLTTTWTDNCSSGGNLSSSQGPIQTNGCAQSRVYTFTVVDICGNPDVETTTVTRYYDIKKPVFTPGSVPPNVTVQCDVVPAPPPATPPMATDNCDLSVTVTMTETRVNGYCADTYILTRKWTAMDDCGNTKTATQKITVRDTQKPVFTFIPPNQTLECADFCLPAIPVETPVAIDNCDADVTILYLGEMCTYFNCPGNRELMRTWKATDNCGNSTIAVQLITIQDTQKPNFTFVPLPVTIECSDLFPVSPGAPTATDDCDPQVQITFNGQTSVAGDCPQEYVVNRKWTATDDCGNTRTATQTITIWDTQAPVFNNPPPNMTAMCGMVPSAPVVTATDNCDNYVPVIYLGESTTGPNCPYTITRTWTVMDDCGNPRTHTQIINVGAAPINGPGGPESNEMVESRQSGAPVHALNVLLAPNPAMAEVWISFETETDGDVTLRLFDVSGRLALQQSFVASVGPNRYRLDLAGLSGGGMYTFHLLVGERHAIERLIILSN